jgi:hypothetical protein
MFKGIRHPDRISGIFCLAFGLFVLLYTMRTLPIGTLVEPQAGFFPFFIGFAITALSLSILFQSFREKGKKLPHFGDRRKRILFTGVGIIFYSLLLESGGFLLCTLLFVFIYLKGIERVGWMGSLLFTVLMVFATYFSFSYFLGVPLPRGILPL